MNDVAADALLQVLELFVALFFVHNKRIALAKGVQANALPEVFHRGEVLDPVGVYDAEHNLALQLAHFAGGERVFYGVVEFGGVLDECVLDFFVGVVVERVGVGEFGGQRHNAAEFADEYVGVPCFGVALQVGFQ